MLNHMNIFIGGMKLFITFLNLRGKLIGNQSMSFMERLLMKIVMYTPVFAMDFFVRLNFVSYFSYIDGKTADALIK